MRLVVLAILAVAVAARVAPQSEAQYQRQFVQFVRDFGKQYDQAEFFDRFNTFKSWVDFVANHNAANNTWEAGINEFSDMTSEQFRAMYLSGLNVAGLPNIQQVEVDISDLPNDVDWRSKGAVNPVKNQGSCGSCWAFSTTGTIEGFTFVKTGTLPNLAEQQLVDCAKTPNTKGCSGGWPWAATQWVGTNGGLCDQKAYPYTARDGTCKKTCTPIAKVSGVVQQKGEDQLAKGVDGMPVSICLDAGGFQSYKGGVFSGPCGTQMNHAVLAVGYTAQYWIVKNSWGPSWGSQGYIFMTRGKNLCGMSNVLAWPQ
jgi:type II secretory pathway pseudopilin PulG